MKKNVLSLVLAVVLFQTLCVTTRCEASVAMKVTDLQAWTDHLIPLPKEVDIAQQVSVPADQVKITLSANAGPIEQNAAKLLKNLFKANADTGAGEFEILIGVCDTIPTPGNASLAADVARMKKLPNNDQAYVIRSEGTNKLILTALNPKGVYYAAQTFKQLIETRFDNKNVTIPLANITDWPDLQYRGYWHNDFSKEELLAMADQKTNFASVHVKLDMTADGHGFVNGIPSKRFQNIQGLAYPEFCRLNAIKCIPIVTHLTHLKKTNIYKHYPELLGKGESAKRQGRSWHAPCSSNPKFTQVLAEWFTSFAEQPGIDEISVWLTEEDIYCSCPKCLEIGKFINETQAILKAWEITKQKYPDFKIQLLLTQGSYPHNDKIIKIVPNDIRLMYYDGGRTYNSSREPMIYPLLENYARQDGWLGVVPQYTVSWAFVLPWSSPQFIKYRMKEFHDKKLKSVEGYATPNRKLYDFNVAAAAEWSWNANGRSEEQFARAWATKKGFKNPADVARWAVSLGDVSWDVFGSSFPYDLLWSDPAEMIKNLVKPPLGTSIFRYFPTPDHFDKNLAVCEKALALAQKIGVPELIEESIVVQGYTRMLKEIYGMCDVISANPELTESQKQMLSQKTADFTQACLDINAAIRKWETIFGKGIGGGRLHNTLRDNKKITVKICEALKEIGVTNPLQQKLNAEKTKPFK